MRIRIRIDHILVACIILLSYDISHLIAQTHDSIPHDPAKQARKPRPKTPRQRVAVDLFGRPLSIGGDFDTAGRYRGNFDLQNRTEDTTVLLDQQLKPTLFYRVTPSIVLSLEGRLRYRYELYDEAGDRDLRWEVERGRMWLHLGPLAKKPLALRIGRQRIKDERQWWWRTDIDAIRLFVASSRVRAEMALAREMARVSIHDDDIDPRADSVLRLLGSVTWHWRPQHQLSAFFLAQHDGSSKPSEGQMVPRARIDPSDANLAWFGLRLLGKTPPGRFGVLKYWGDSAVVAGEETWLRFGPNDNGRHPITTRRQQKVLGWAVDVGISWQLPLRWQPMFTVGYAVGSGEKEPQSGTNRTFRQTGLQTNKARFSGDKRFRYYGELLRPELANLHIWTAALGLRLWKAGGVDIAYHLYRQVEPLPFLSRARLRLLPQGQSRAIGQEWDVVFSYSIGKTLRMALTGAVFRAGAAYGEHSGALATNVVLQTKLKF